MTYGPLPMMTYGPLPMMTYEEQCIETEHDHWLSQDTGDRSEKSWFTVKWGFLVVDVRQI